MKLIQCQVENFGKLSNVMIDFTGGIHTICRENGWGKSTLAAFICAMFYGLANDRKKNETENERLHYRPWQQGPFGGNLTFSDGIGTYTVYRTFGSKVGEDTFELREWDTNHLSDAYSRNLGEELFQIDRDSFLRTAFISQDSCEVLATSEINAKIHDLVEDTGDINNYDRANRNLLGKMNAFGDSRSTGKLARLKKRAVSLDMQIQQMKGNEEDLELLRSRKDQYLAELIQAEKEEEDLLKTQHLLEYLRLRDEVTRRGFACQDMENFFGRRIPAIEELEQQAEEKRKIDRLKQQRENEAFSRAEQRTFEELSRMFADEIPDKDTFARQAGYISKIQRIDERLRDLEKKVPLGQSWEPFRDAFGTEDYRELLPNEAFDDLIEEWEHKKEEPEEKKPWKRIWNNRANLLYFVPCFFLLIIGVTILFLSFTALGTGIIVFSLMLALFFALKMAGLISFKMIEVSEEEPDEAPGTVEESETEERLEIIPEKYTGSEELLSGKRMEAALEDISPEADLEETVSAEGYENRIRTLFVRFEEEYGSENTIKVLLQMRTLNMTYRKYLIEREEIIQAMEEEHERKEQEKADLQAKVLSFISEFTSHNVLEDELGDVLAGIAADAEQYRRYRDRIDRIQAAEEQILELEEKHQNFLNLHSSSPAVDLTGLSHARIRYEALLFEYQQAQQKLEDYLGRIRTSREVMEMEVAELQPDLAGSINTEEMVIQLRTNSRRQKDYQGMLTDIEGQIARMEDFFCQCRNLEEEYSHVQEEIQLAAHEYEVARLTREILTEARENLTVQYMDPLMKRFLEYYRLIDPEEKEEFHIDTETRLTFMGGGQQRELKMLSRAYLDLAGLCMRIALLDVMYQGEKPFIVMDDPFINLDEEHLLGAIAFLKKVSARYQIIFLTCHEEIIKNL